MTHANFLAAMMLGTLALIPAAVRAETFRLERPIAGASLHAEGVDMAVYYVDRDDHFEVVATYAAAEGPFEPARIRMALADGDGTRLGLPGMGAVLYAFRREGDTVVVEANRVGEELARLAP